MACIENLFRYAHGIACCIILGIPDQQHRRPGSYIQQLALFLGSRARLHCAMRFAKALLITSLHKFCHGTSQVFIDKSTEFRSITERFHDCRYPVHCPKPAYINDLIRTMYMKEIFLFGRRIFHAAFQYDIFRLFSGKLAGTGKSHIPLCGNDIFRRSYKSASPLRTYEKTAFCQFRNRFSDGDPTYIKLLHQHGL